MRSAGASEVPLPDKPPATAPKPKRSASLVFPRYALVAAIAVGILGVTLGAWAVFSRDTWEQNNREKILGLCAEASASAKTGELTRFNAKHAELLALVGLRKVEDQELKGALRRVEDARNILTAAAKREAEKVGQAEAARRQTEQERKRLEAEARLAAEKMQRQKEEAERLALEEKKRREDAEAQRRAEEEEQRLAAEARQNAEKERERLVTEVNRRAEEEKQRKAESQRQAEEQGRREAEATQQAQEEKARQEAKAALAGELARITASLEQAKAEDRAAVQERNQLQYKYTSERQQVQQQYQAMVDEIEKRYKAERRSNSIPGSRATPEEWAEYERQRVEIERRRSERLLAAQAWRTNQYREIDQRYQPQVTAIDRKIAQLKEVVKSLTQSQADLQNRLKRMK